MTATAKYLFFLNPHLVLCRKASMLVSFSCHYLIHKLIMKKVQLMLVLTVKKYGCKRNSELFRLKGSHEDGLIVRRHS